MNGFQQAMDLISLAKSLKISINPEFDKLVLIEDVPKSIKLKGITFWILGPSKKNLEKLRQEWKDWLNKKKLNRYTEFELPQILDKSVPNLSGIMLLVADNNNKNVFTGDGLGDDIANVLTRNAMLDKQG
jgi:hypothetical protein